MKKSSRNKTDGIEVTTRSIIAEVEKLDKLNNSTMRASKLNEYLATTQIKVAKNKHGEVKEDLVKAVKTRNLKTKT